jgi:hypothetical protein
MESKFDGERGSQGRPGLEKEQRLLSGTRVLSMTSVAEISSLNCEGGNIMRRLLTAVSILVLCAACGSSGSSSGTPTCAEAIGNLYAIGCTVTENGNAITESDALNGCNQIQAQINAGTCACASQFNAGLSCYNSEAQCGNCSSQNAAYNSCAASCSSSNITQSSAVGTWTLSFQWQGRTPGAIMFENESDGTVTVPGGQPGDSATTTYGTWSVSGNQITWVFSDSTWTGTATSSTAITGTILKTETSGGVTEGTTGSFSGTE